MALPAGYSSDEDEFDGFEEEDYISRNPLSHSPINAVDEKEFKLDQLFFNVVNGEITEIQKELENGLDPNAILKDNWSLLLLAASVGNPEMTKLLIERGADVNYDKDKFTVLMAACNCPSSCSPSANVSLVVEQLLEKGANVNAVTRRRMTALMYACSSGNLEVVKLLLPLSNKFATDNQGWNVFIFDALFWAVNDNKPDVVEFLLDEGFKETQLDVRNNTPLSYAVANGCQRVIELFPSRQDDLEKNYNTVHTDFESIFTNLQKGERPPYPTELYNMLCGSNSERTMSCFVANNISLTRFLSMTDKELQSIGIKLPFQRYKILNSFYRFHKHPYLPTSIPSVAKDDLYSNIEVAKSVAAAVRQVVCMEATINYLIANYDMFCDSIDKKTLRTSINNICDKLVKLKNTSKALHRRALHWDYLNSPADLIRKGSCRRKYPIKIKIIGVLLLPVILVACKMFLSRR